MLEKIEARSRKMSLNSVMLHEHIHRRSDQAKPSLRLRVSCLLPDKRNNEKPRCYRHTPSWNPLLLFSMLLTPCPFRSSPFFPASLLLSFSHTSFSTSPWELIGGSQSVLFCLSGVPLILKTQCIHVRHFIYIIIVIAVTIK